MFWISDVWVGPKPAINLRVPFGHLNEMTNCGCGWAELKSAFFFPQIHYPYISLNVSYVFLNFQVETCRFTLLKLIKRVNIAYH